MAHKPLSRIPKNRKKKMTEEEMQTMFINENMDILHKYLLWKETILPSQIVDSNVKIEADDVDFEDIN